MLESGFDLLKCEPYRSTQLPELVAFFRQAHGPKVCSPETSAAITATQQTMLVRFLRRFAATNFECPSHALLEQITAERAAMERVRADESIENVLAVIADTGVKFARLDEIYRTLLGREIPSPGFADESTPRLLIDAAVAAAKEAPATVRDQVALAYRLKGEALEGYRAAMGFKKKKKAAKAVKINRRLLKRAKKGRRK